MSGYPWNSLETETRASIHRQSMREGSTRTRTCGCEIAADNDRVWLCSYHSGYDDAFSELRNFVRRIVGEAIGEASTCWDDLGAAGVFDSERASRIANDLCQKLGTPPYPGSTP